MIDETDGNAISDEIKAVIDRTQKLPVTCQVNPPQYQPRDRYFSCRSR
jgi:hypothetical protein